MAELVARTGRQQQLYEHGCRLIAGSADDDSTDTSAKTLEVLMISSTSGHGLVFPKGGWENDETVEEAAVREAVEEAGVRGELLGFLGYYEFKSKTLKDEFCPEGVCKAFMFALLVKEELQCWPEKSTRERSWLTIPQAVNACRYEWMRSALEEGFLKWHANQTRTSKVENHKILTNLSPHNC